MFKIQDLKKLNLKLKFNNSKYGEKFLSNFQNLVKNRIENYKLEIE